MTATVIKNAMEQLHYRFSEVYTVSTTIYHLAVYTTSVMRKLGATDSNRVISSFTIINVIIIRISSSSSSISWKSRHRLISSSYVIVLIVVLRRVIDL